MKRAICVEEMGGCGRWWKYSNLEEQKPLQCPWCGAKQNMLTVIDEGSGYRKKEDTEETGLSDKDIEIIAKEINLTQHDRMKIVFDIIDRLSKENIENNAPLNEILREAEIEGLEENQIIDTIFRLRRNGQIYEPIKDKYKITDY